MGEPVPIPLVGPTYQNSSVEVNNQHTQNFFIEVNPGTPEPLALRPFPGCKLWTTTGVGAIRGLGTRDGTLYAISGEELYEIDSAGTATKITGTIPGSDYVVTDDDGTHLVMTVGPTGGQPLTYDGATLTQGGSNLASSYTCTFINRRIVYDGYNSNQLIFADLDTPLTANSANIALTETDSDDTIAVKAHKNQVYAGGGKSIEPWYPTGSGNPPYQKVSNTVEQLGVAGPYTYASNQNYLYFLGSDLTPYQISGVALRPIGNPAICQDIRKYSRTDDCKGFCFSFDSLNFFFMTFPTAKKSWLFNEQSGMWTSLAYGNNGENAHLMIDYQYVYGKHIVGDRRNGNLYELDFNTFQDDGDIIQRRRTTAAVDSSTLGARPGLEVFMDCLEIEIETGVSLVTAEANIIMQYSDDNGRTWSSERWQSIGPQGEYKQKIQWFGFESFSQSRVFRFTMTDPVNWVLISCHADLELGYN